MLDPTVQQMEMQVGERTSGVMVMNAAVRVRSAVWVGKMRLAR